MINQLNSQKHSVEKKKPSLTEKYKNCLKKVLL